MLIRGDAIARTIPNVVFADTHYWVALLSLRDPHHKRAKEAAREIGAAGARTITSDFIFTETLATFSRSDGAVREAAAKMVEAALSDPNTEVLPARRDDFAAGMKLYRARLDKSYSLVDCISMTQMKGRSIDVALTHDVHFEQEGFVRWFR